MNDIKRHQLKEGMNLYFIPVSKFKTASISLHIHRPLSREEAALNALLTDVLMRGSRAYPDSPSIERATQELCGAYLDGDVRKKGEDQILTFGVNALSDRYARGADGIVRSAFDLLAEIVLNPLVVGDGFREDYVEQEKTNLVNDIEAVINDKRAYSVMRTVELMCEGEPYAVHELGTVDDVKRITPQSLYAHYKRVLQEGPIDVFVTGDVDEDALCAQIAERFAHVRPSETRRPTTRILQGPATVREVVEEFDVAQAKLCMGFRTHVAPDSDDYFKLMVYNGVLGGGAHSKLFNNVREKLSLAYYCGSRLERFKGLMIISSGIEAANRETAIAEINAQIEDVRAGRITDYEYDATIKSIVNSIRSLGDSIGHLEDYYLGQTLGGHTLNLEAYASRIERVTREDVAAVAQKIEPELVYFLTGKQKED